MLTTPRVCLLSSLLSLLPSLPFPLIQYTFIPSPDFLGGGESDTDNSSSFLFFFKHLYWSTIALQWCVSFCFTTQ